MKTELLPEKFDRVHIDGDILIYGICSACEYCARFDEDLDVVFCNLNEAMGMAEATMAKYEAMTKGKLTIHFTGSGNYRKEIYPEYKAHRKKVRKPAGFRALKEMLEQKYHCMTENGIEADDLIGLCHTRDSHRGLTSLIISTDKDFKTIPGWIYNPDHDAFTFVKPEEADRNWLLQTLTGDKTDGYPGLEGVGPVTAAKILKQGTWQEVEDAYVNSGFTPEYALNQARLARILRMDEYDWDSRKVRLWQPAKN